MKTALIPTHKVGQWLVDAIDRLLEHVGVEHSSTLEEILYTIIVLGAALFFGWSIRCIVVFITQKIVYSHKTPFIQDLKKQDVIVKSSHIIPPLVFRALIPFAFETDPATLNLIERGIWIYFSIVLGWTICAIFNIIWNNFNRKENVHNLPLMGILSVSKGLIWIFIAIIVISIVINRSPATLIAGLGAFAAALMLIFKDSILGFVAGIQLSINDMLHVGDWITVPGTIANGIVTDMSLTAVTIRNWDNTTITLPPYTLVSTSFQNYNKMKDRGRRQIKMSLLVDVTTVCPTTPEMLETWKSIPYLKEYIENMQKSAAAGDSTALKDPAKGIEVNGSITTNLGVFRAYTTLFLHRHPYVAMGQPMCMVYIEQPTPQGVPLVLYCYVNTIEWEMFEGIQSDIFEHLIAIAPTFGLSAFMAPTARAMNNIGNPKPQGLPYYGTTPPETLTYNPTTNFMVPPNVSGDPGFPKDPDTTYPDTIAEAVEKAKAQGIPVLDKNTKDFKQPDSPPDK